MEKKRSAGGYAMVTLKGLAMGAADVVPGVSGGTIAFISGIYEELLNSIKSIGGPALKLLFRGRLVAFWKAINGNFLASLVLGIAISIFSLAKGMTWLLENEPIATWSFFFGLIIASTLLVSRDVTRWGFGTVLSFIGGGVASYLITMVSPASTPDTWWFVILSGAIAVCAMILPGISGAFILLLLGKYAFVMDAVANLRIGTILLFVGGAVTGIVLFSKFLSWLLAHHRNGTVSLLAGFMLGSLNKVWPWKETLETYTDSHGAVHPLTEASISPNAYGALTESDPQLWIAIGMCVAGFLLIWVIETIAKKISRKMEATEL